MFDHYKAIVSFWSLFHFKLEVIRISGHQNFKGLEIGTAPFGIHQCAWRLCLQYLIVVSLLAYTPI